MCPSIIWPRIASAFVFEMSLFWEQMIINTTGFVQFFFLYCFSVTSPVAMTNIHLSTVSPFFLRDSCECGSQFAFHKKKFRSLTRVVSINKRKK
jgi:hypothetical protein